MRHVNITFAVNWDNCSSAIQEIFIKVAAMEDGYLSEVCKLTHSRRECSVSTGTSDCRCLTPVGPVSFVARVGEDEQTFVWTWQYQGSSKEETTKTVVFSREPTVHRNMSIHRPHSILPETFAPHYRLPRILSSLPQRRTAVTYTRIDVLPLYVLL